MSRKIHHNTAKKAKKFGITLTFSENEFEASNDQGRVLGMHASASTALELAIAQLKGNAKGTDPVARIKKADKIIRRAKAPKPRDEDGEDEEVEDETGNSIIKPKYKTRYRPFKMTCGDDLAAKVADHVKFKDEDGKMRVDPAKLKAFAVANECWVPAYKDLNVGMRRMNVVNRLRAKVRKGWVVQWA